VSGARLLAVSAARPRRVVGNAELAGRVGVDDAWVRARTGIVERRLAGDGESVVELAAQAGGKALAAAGVVPVDVDLLLLATCTLPTPLPAGAPQVAARLGIPGGALDVNAACAGFCSALALAADSVRAGSSGHVLVVGADRFSDWLDWDDRGTSLLFGDGAGAAVVGPAAEEEIGPVVWGSDGAGSGHIAVPDWGRHLQMRGTEVFRWATSAIAPVAREACARAGIAPRDLAAVIPHQANLRIVTALARDLGVGPQTVVADDVVRSGNTSAASVPLALDALVTAGRVRPGDPALLVAFGAGLTWAAQVVRCP